MNIFYIDSDPIVCAREMVDKHVVKMILETAQLLSTAHRVLDGQSVIVEKYVAGSLPPRHRKTNQWKLDDERDSVLYSATHVNHPSAIWCRKSNNNYNWLYCHLIGLCEEYTYRYGKIHKVQQSGLLQALQMLPKNIPVSYFSPPTPAMPDEYKVATVMESYRNYYREAKSALHKWTKRPTPEWIYTK